MARPEGAPSVGLERPQDYLGTIPEDTLFDCVRMTTAYASQNVDLNVSLTAIGLMWNMADFFGRTITTLLNIRSVRRRSPHGMYTYSMHGRNHGRW